MVHLTSSVHIFYRVWTLAFFFVNEFFTYIVPFFTDTGLSASFIISASAPDATDSDFIAAGFDCVYHCSVAVARSVRRLKSGYVLIVLRQLQA